MFRLVRKPSDGVFDVGGGEFRQSGFVASGDEFGERGAGGDGGGAAADFEAGLRDAAVFDRTRRAAEYRRRSGFETSTVTAGGGNSPTFRGLRKCSIELRGRAPIVAMTEVVAGVLEDEGKDSHLPAAGGPGSSAEVGVSGRQTRAGRIAGGGAGAGTERGTRHRGERGAGTDAVRIQLSGKKPILLIFSQGD